MATARFFAGRRPMFVAVAVAAAAALLYGAVFFGFQGEYSTIPASVASANNAFAVDFYRQVSDEEKNIFFSPVSMFTAYSMAYEGAVGGTASQMQEVFGFEPDAGARHNATAHVLSSINRQDTHAELSMANSAWLYNLAPSPSYVDIVRDTYMADIGEYRTQEEGASMINAWVSDKTRGKITEAVKPKELPKGDQAGMFLANAAYFKGTWVTWFPAEDTRESDFWVEPGRSVRTDFMNVEGIFNITKDGNALVLKMPYKGDRLSMLVALPHERDGIRDLEETITAETIREWRQSMAESDLAVSMPKFKLELTYNLIGPLHDMGVVDAFDRSRADFSGIAPLLFIKDSLHKTYVDVNEEGTEAAAVTTINMFQVSMPPPPQQFVADHPFIFTILDNESGTIFFMGRISDPTA